MKHEVMIFFFALVVLAVGLFVIHVGYFGSFTGFATLDGDFSDSRTYVSSRSIADPGSDDILLSGSIGAVVFILVVAFVLKIFIRKKQESHEGRKFIRLNVNENF